PNLERPVTGGVSRLNELKHVLGLLLPAHAKTEVDGDRRAGRAAQNVAERQAGGLADDVPAGDVDGADGGGLDPFRTDPGRAVEHLVPEADHVARVLADDDRLESLLDHATQAVHAR